MGLMNWLFGNRDVGSVVSQVGGVFRANAEAEAQRTAEQSSAALDQFGREFTARRNWFDSLIDGINRLPRPTFALGTLALFIYCVTDPVEFTIRMQALQLVPDPLWWLLGAVVSFYFGTRHMEKRLAQSDVGATVAATAARAPEVMETMARLRGALSPDEANHDLDQAEIQSTDNPALDAWRRQNG